MNYWRVSNVLALVALCPVLLVPLMSAGLFGSGGYGAYGLAAFFLAVGLLSNVLTLNAAVANVREILRRQHVPALLLFLALQVGCWSWLAAFMWRLYMGPTG